MKRISCCFVAFAIVLTVSNVLSPDSKTYRVISPLLLISDAMAEEISSIDENGNTVTVIKEDDGTFIKKTTDPEGNLIKTERNYEFLGKWERDVTDHKTGETISDKVHDITPEIPGTETETPGWSKDEEITSIDENGNTVTIIKDDNDDWVKTTTDPDGNIITTEKSYERFGKWERDVTDHKTGETKSDKTWDVTPVIPGTNTETPGWGGYEEISTVDENGNTVTVFQDDDDGTFIKETRDPEGNLITTEKSYEQFGEWKREVTDHKTGETISDKTWNVTPAIPGTETDTPGWGGYEEISTVDENGNTVTVFQDDDDGTFIKETRDPEGNLISTEKVHEVSDDVTGKTVEELDNQYKETRSEIDRLKEEKKKCKSDDCRDKVQEEITKAIARAAKILNEKSRLKKQERDKKRRESNNASPGKGEEKKKQSGGIIGLMEDVLKDVQKSSNSTEGR